MTSTTAVPWAAAIETATAGVFLVGDVAVKVKKPLDFGYVDYRTADARRRACENEVRLNRRLAPDVYLGVMDLAVDGEVKDHLVLMRRMPDAKRLSSLLAHESPACVTKVILPAVISRVADFHADVERVCRTDGPGSHAAVRELWDEGIAALNGRGQAMSAAVAGISALATAYLDGRQLLFDERLQAGCVRDGHGDLLADDIFVLDDGPRILDCLEFDERLRVGDVWMDIAFLAMDVERLGHRDYAQALLEMYAHASDNSAPRSLQHFFVAYRALVRAKVAAIRHAQGDPQSLAEAHQLAQLCLEHLRQATVTLTLVGGLPATGKTTLANALAARTGARCLSSDVIRKEIHGLDPAQPHPEAWTAGLYDAAATRRTYDEMSRRAATALGHGESVVLDATWRDADLRQQARQVARDAAAAVVEIRCEAPTSTVLRRLETRAGGSSDADDVIYRHISKTFAAWPQAVTVATGRRDPCPQAIAATQRAITQFEVELRT